jgi:hypothetical protein
MDHQRKYEEIVAEYNREKDRATIEETFRRLVEAGPPRQDAIRRPRPCWDDAKMIDLTAA